MSTLWTPPSAQSYREPTVAREHWQAMLAWEAQVMQCLEWDGGILTHWNTELAKIDPLLRLAQAKLLAKVAGVMPGYFHLVRLRDPGTQGFMMLSPLMGPDGEFVEPSDAMLRGLRAADLQNRRAVEDRVKRDVAAKKLAEIEEARDDMDRQDEIHDRLNAITRTQITMSDGPWSQNHKGSTRPTRGKGR